MSRHASTGKARTHIQKVYHYYSLHFLPFYHFHGPLQAKTTSTSLPDFHSTPHCFFSEHITSISLCSIYPWTAWTASIGVHLCPVHCHVLVESTQFSSCFQSVAAYTELLSGSCYTTFPSLDWTKHFQIQPSPHNASTKILRCSGRFPGSLHALPMLTGHTFLYR